MFSFKKNKPQKKSEIKRILNAFKYSYDGFVATFKSEAAFKEDVLIFVLLLPVVFLVNVSSAQRVLLFFALLFILFAECTNTAIEVAIDRISKDIHPLSKKAKDIGSFLVFLSFVNAIVTWAIILL